MLDRTKLPRSFSVPYAETSFDFVITNASDESSLVLNVSGASGQNRLQFPNGLKIDRHAGTFNFADNLQEHLSGLRPAIMKANAIPAKLLSVAWRAIGGILGAAPGRFFLGGGAFALGWNLTMLAIMIALIAFAATIGIYVVAPLLAIAVICFILEVAYFQPNETQRIKSFMDAIGGNVRDLVEDTVTY